MSPLRPLSLIACMLMFVSSEARSQGAIDVQLRFQQETKAATQTRDEKWLASETAIIVCDVWDYHHCLNAVRRLEEFAPRLNDVLIEARKRGVTVIHSPSDCMDAYVDHPARLRAMQAPKASQLPEAIDSWCSIIPSEERAVYPIDQSDGGEDDDPQEHAEWAAKLKSLGRNPNMPWKEQSALITIDEQADYISDRGTEVWNVLTSRHIKNVILTGVHTNMCVLGRPFGLRQMVRNGKNVVLMRDMTDTMYNPKRWPYVNHFEGTRRIISHIERFVCPTITSDQLIGGEPFQFSGDSEAPHTSDQASDPNLDWTIVSVPVAADQHVEADGSRWYRCVVRIPKDWLNEKISLKCPGSDSPRAWFNGQELQGRGKTSGVTSFTILTDQVEADDANLVVLQLRAGLLSRCPVLQAGSRKLSLAGSWQYRVGDDSMFSQMPLPAKFGTPTDIVFVPKEPRNGDASE